MRRLSVGPLVALLATPPPPQSVAAQTGPQPNLVPTLFGGAVAGHTLWSIARQPLGGLATAPGGFASHPPPQSPPPPVSPATGPRPARPLPGPHFQRPHP